MVESPAMNGPETARARLRRRLTLTDYMVRVPLGVLSMMFLALIAVPVMIYMTALYYAARWTDALFAGRRRSRSGPRWPSSRGAGGSCWSGGRIPP